MPELPEVETMRRSLTPSIGRMIHTVTQPVSRYRPIVTEPNFEELRNRLVGRVIESVGRLGKRVVVNLDNESHLLFQPKMAGLVLMDTPPNQSHIRLIITLVDQSLSEQFVDSSSQIFPDGDCSTVNRIIYWDQRGLGTVRLWTSLQMTSFLDSGVLGPDAVDVDYKTFRRRFSSLSRPIKPALLDQSRIAGIGNLYASEILHRSGVHPETLCNRISNAVWKRIYDSTQVILLTAIEHEGSTLSDGTYRKSKENTGSYQNSHRVYDRSGLDCLKCRTGNIVRIIQSQRSTFFCPHCQKTPKSSFLVVAEPSNREC